MDINGLKFDMEERIISLMNCCAKEEFLDQLERISTVLYEFKVLIEAAYYDCDGNYILRLDPSTADYDTMIELKKSCSKK